MEGSRRDIDAHIPPKANPKGLTFEERERLTRLFMDIRQQAMSPIGMLEFRNLLSRLFDDFDAVRDPDIDDLIRQLAERQDQQHPDQLQLT